MTNDSLSLVTAAIEDVEAELGKLNQYLELAQASRATIEKLESDIDARRADKGDLERKTRASKLTNAKTMLELEQGDLATFDREVDRQFGIVVQHSLRAQSLLQQLWSALLASRKASVEPKNTNGGAENRVVPLTRKHLRINGFSPGRSIAERWD